VTLSRLLLAALAGALLAGCATVPGGSGADGTRADALVRLAVPFFPDDSDLRGARRLGVPGDPVGLLTTLYDGVELRLGDVLPYRLQPLVFVDAAMGGRSSLKLDPNVYWSPGFGVRWGSPVGSVRATLARGLVWRRDPAAEVLLTPQWRFFLSLGREF
jgi:translocation and assembly module TamA